MKNMIVWVRNDLVPKETYSMIKKLWVCIFITQFIDMALPIFISLIQDGSQTEKFIGSYVIVNKISSIMQSYYPTLDVGTCYIIIGISCHIIMAVILYNIAAYYRYKIAEKILYFNMWELSKKITEKFFEKSVGMLENEDNFLTEASIRKGYEKIQHIQTIVIFALSETFFKTSLILIAIFIKYDQWQIRALASLMAISHFIWGVCLNYFSTTSCEPIEEGWRFFNRYRNERWQQPTMVKVNNKVKEEISEMKRHYDTAGIPDFQLWGIDYNLHTRFRVMAIHIFLASIYAYGAYLAKADLITIGMLYPLFWWSSQLSGNLWQLADIENNFNKNAPSILLMKKSLDLPVGIKISPNPIKIKKGTPMTIEFIDVSCSYPPDKDSPEKAPVVLKNINLKVCPGDKIGIVGPSGIGKSTLISVFMRFRDPIKGKILINGIEIEAYDPDSLYENISYIGQTSENFDGTIEYNFKYGLSKEEAEKIPEQELEKLMEELDLCNGARWAKGVKTVIGSRGKKLSGGQNQRVAVARAIVKKAPILFGDEITSSVDSSTEKKIQKLLTEKLGKDMTVFMVSHHYDTLRTICNKFVMIDRASENPNDGNTIVATAHSLEELAAKNERFREIASHQGLVL